MTDPTPPDTGWPHEQLEPGSPAQLVHQALAEAHPSPLALDELVDTVGPGTAADIDAAAVADALGDLDEDGIVTPSTRDLDADPPALWMLHGPARRAADETQAREGA